MTSVSTDRRLGVNAGAAVKVPCRAASTGNLTLSGEQTIDGVACVTGDRVLVKNQTSGAQNGIYIVDTGTWGRAPDWDGAYDVVTGTAVYITSGSSNSGTYWAVTTTGTITIGTTSVAFTNAVISSAASISTIQSGTGAISESVQTGLRRTWYPEQFGAVGDGVTDDAAAWALLLTAVGSSNFEIKGKPGATYLIGATGIAVTSKTNGKILGNGAKIKLNAVSTLLAGGFAATTIYLSSCTRVSLSGWEIDGNNINSNPIAVSASTECDVSHNTITAAHNFGAIIAYNNTRNRYTYNTVRDGYASGTARGLWIGNTPVNEVENEPLIEGNRVYNMLATAIGGTAIGAIINANHCITSGGSGIALGAVTGREYTRSVISNNICRDNTFSGIQSDATTSVTSFLIITGNLCEENDTSGIYVANCTDSVITGNICRNNNNDASGNGYGVQVYAAKRIVVSNNLSTDTRAGGSRTQVHGIYVSADTAGGIEDVLIQGNICRNNTSAGIKVETSTPGTITGVCVVGNHTPDNAANGIVVVEAGTAEITEATVVGNHCIGNGTSDLRVNPTDIVLASNRYVSSTAYIPTFASTDTTPSVKGRSVFKTGNASGTVISAFDDGVTGQEINVIIGDANTSFDFTGTTLKGNAGSDWTANTNDSLICVFDGTNWYCRISDNSA